MTVKFLLAAAACALAVGGCQTIPRNQTLATYCSDAKHANKDVCKVKVEIDGQQRALAETNVGLKEARAIAEEARSAAATAQQTADAKQMYCETRTLQRTNIGSCSAGYTLVGCTQTRYTYRAGGPSIMRSIDDQQCRFHDKVLELQARCCTTAGARPLSEQPSNMSTPEATTNPQPAS